MPYPPGTGCFHPFWSDGFPEEAFWFCQPTLRRQPDAAILPRRGSAKMRSSSRPPRAPASGRNRGQARRGSIGLYYKASSPFSVPGHQERAPPLDVQFGSSKTSSLRLTLIAILVSELQEPDVLDQAGVDAWDGGDCRCWFSTTQAGERRTEGAAPQENRDRGEHVRRGLTHLQWDRSTRSLGCDSGQSRRILRNPASCTRSWRPGESSELLSSRAFPRAGQDTRRALPSGTYRRSASLRFGVAST